MNKESILADHYLDDSKVNYAWNREHRPRLTIDPGDTVAFRTRDAGDLYYNVDSTAEDVEKKGPLVGHPLTGPVYVRGAAPGGVLAVKVVDVTPDSFAWTAIRPGKGLLPPEDFPNAFLQIWDLSDGRHARMRQRDDIAIPISPFPGIMGTALAQPGDHSTIPPRENGGNMDLKYLTVGSTLYLPIWVEGALFSVGDAHAAQGDGEVCITAAEMSATVTLNIDLAQQGSLAEPQMRTPGPLAAATAQGPFFATTAQGPDLYASSQQAIRYMIDHLVSARGLSREEAYILCSVTVDLKITEIVDAPNWMVSAFLPECIFIQ